MNDNSKKIYEKKYAEGYGVQFPDGHVVRFYERVLKYEFKISPEGKYFLDFGCGNGVHSVYFASKGFIPYGVDVSEMAISQCVDRFNADQFKTIVPNQDIANVFGDIKFDLIFANQSLYYIPTEELKQTIKNMYDITADGGFIFATMMSSKNYYYNNITKKLSNGLSEISLSGRLNEVSYINFINDKESILNLFCEFECVGIGEYDSFNIFNREGSAHHYIYIGRKK